MRIWDSLTSVVSGLGTSKDKMTSLEHVYRPLTRQEIEAAYRGDWIVRKAIDIPPYDEVKNWRDWQASKPEIQKLEDEEKRLGVQRKVFRARTLARLHGGAAIYIGTTDSDLSLPLLPDRIGAGGIVYLHVLTRAELTASSRDLDVTSQWFGEPEMWQMVNGTSGQLAIHPSRIIKFIGNPVPDPSLAIEPWYGDSVLDAIDDAVKQAGLTLAGVAAMIHEAKIDVISIPGLMQRAGDKEYTKKLIERFTLANQMKSLVNSLVIDSLETFNTKSQNFSTLPEIIDRYLQVVSGAADIPATRFLGQSPAGMNATGESDYRNYLDRIAAGQSLDLQPSLSPLDEALIRSALGSRPANIHYTWAPLWGMTEKEKAEVQKTKADYSKVYHDLGVIPYDAFAKAVVNSLVEDVVYPGLEQAIAESPEKVGEQPPEDELAAAGETGEAAGRTRAVAGTRRLPPKTAKQIAARDSRPMSLYICRKVLNADDIRRWAKSQGIPDIEDDLHVTITYSKQPIDWMAAATDTYWGEFDADMKIAGGPRIIEKFGENSTVLLFSSRALQYRHSEINETTGATWDFPEYQPHVTLSYTDNRPKEEIEPYIGPIVLGPEVWSEIKEAADADA